MPGGGLGRGALTAGFLLAALLARRAAGRGDAPAWFARLRPPQLLLGVAGLGVCDDGRRLVYTEAVMVDCRRL